MNLRANLLPIFAVVGGASAAAFGFGLRQTPTPTAREIKAEDPSPPAVAIPDEEPTSQTAVTLSGEVLERIDVEKYTYLRLGEPGAAGTWAAVPSAEGVRVGERIRVRSAELMSNFASATLKRTFDSIYFGVLDSGPVGPSAASNPHAGPIAVGSAASAIKVARAKGALGRTVAELFAQRKALEGKNVRVRGVVVKNVGGVLERTFLHVQDGSGNAGDNDLTVTTTASPAVGSTVLLEGKVVTEKDFGMGYRYPVLLEDARLVEE